MHRLTELPLQPGSPNESIKSSKVAAMALAISSLIASCGTTPSAEPTDSVEVPDATNQSQVPATPVTVATPAIVPINLAYVEPEEGSADPVTEGSGSTISDGLHCTGIESPELRTQCLANSVCWQNFGDGYEAVLFEDAFACFPSIDGKQIAVTPNTIVYSTNGSNRVIPVCEHSQFSGAYLDNNHFEGTRGGLSGDPYAVVLVASALGDTEETELLENLEPYGYFRQIEIVTNNYGYYIIQKGEFCEYLQVIEGTQVFDRRYDCYTKLGTIHISNFFTNSCQPDVSIDSCQPDQRTALSCIEGLLSGAELQNVCESLQDTSVLYQTQ